MKPKKAENEEKDVYNSTEGRNVFCNKNYKNCVFGI